MDSQSLANSVMEPWRANDTSARTSTVNHRLSLNGMM